MKAIKETCYKGTRILLGNEKRDYINKCIECLKGKGYVEISIPIIQFQEIFNGKVGEENNNMMFNFQDRGNRDICLAPEYTAIIQKLAKSYFQSTKDLKVFYVQECFRGESPQKGRYRQFTQLGIEIINPKKYSLDDIIEDSLSLINMSGLDFKLNEGVKRGLDYYKNGKGFELTCESLGSSKQICGGGEYDGGIGCAIGIDRIF